MSGGRAGGRRDDLTTPNDHDVIVMPHGDDEVVVFGRGLGEWTELLDRAMPVIGQIVGLLGETDATSNDGIGVRYFRIRPEDEAAFRRYQRSFTEDGYFRATLRNEDGFAHQLAFKETEPAAVASQPPLDPSMLLAAAQLAAIQQQLARMEDVLDEIVVDLQAIIENLQRNQAASAAAAVSVLREVTENRMRGGRLSSADWDRIAGVEETVRQQLIAVVDEMVDFADHLYLTGRLAEDRKLPKRLSPGRWRSLVEQSSVLASAGLQWVAAYSVKLQQDDEYEAEAVEAAYETFAELIRRRGDAIATVDDAMATAPVAARRSTRELLFSDGIPVGRAKDTRDLAALERFRSELCASTQPFAEMAALPPPVLALQQA